MRDAFARTISNVKGRVEGGNGGLSYLGELSSFYLQGANPRDGGRRRCTPICAACRRS